MTGYYFAKDKNRWVARIKVNSEMLRLGQFENEKEAAQAYDYAARQLGRTDLNYPGKSVSKAIREVVKPKLDKFNLAKKVESAVAKVDEKIWNEGETEGAMWASFCPALSDQVLAITHDSIAMEEPSVIAGMIGCEEDFDDIVTGIARRTHQPIKSKISQLAFIRGFLIGAQKYFKDLRLDKERELKRLEMVRKQLLASKQAQNAVQATQDAPNAKPEAMTVSSVVEPSGELPEAIKQSRQHLSELLAEMQAKRKKQNPDQEDTEFDLGGLVPGTFPQPNGEVWSADCNPETLARDIAKTAECHKNRTGIFAMMDAIDRENAKKREIEAMLAEIL